MRVGLTQPEPNLLELPSLTNPHSRWPRPPGGLSLEARLRYDGHRGVPPADTRRAAAAAVGLCVDDGLLGEGD